MKFAFFAFLMIGFGTAQAQTGNDLLEQCGHGERIVNTPSGQPSGANTSLANRCLGFLTGFTQGVKIESFVSRSGPNAFCIPQGVIAQQLQTIALNWMRANPNKLHEPGSVVLTIAYSEAFPCPKP